MSAPLAVSPSARERQAGALARARVAILSGGRSSEREVSLRSAAAIAEALGSSAVEVAGPAHLAQVEIARDGTWRGAGLAARPVEWLARAPGDTVFFLGLHGGEGEDGTIQGLLESSGFLYTGSGVAASALCMNKHWTRLLLREAGLTTARGRCADAREWADERNAVLADVRALGDDGWSIKPNRGGSSVSTFLLGPDGDPEPAIEAVLATGDDVLVEARIPGIEATCGVLGNAGGELHALTPVEIVPRAGRFFDYEQKYSPTGADEHCPPLTLSHATCDRLCQLARTGHRVAGCDGYSRMDFIVPRDARGREGEPVVLEINTLPGLTDRSLVPLAAQADGIDFRALCLEILALTLERQAVREQRPKA